MNHSRFVFLAVTLALLAACHPNTTATTGPVDNSPPVATVNGKPISRDLYEFYVKGITSGKTSADLSPQQRNKALDNLIGGRLVADEAIKDGLDKDPDTAYILQLTRFQVLEQAVEQRYLKDRKPTEQELRAEYETQLAAMPKTEYHARHILVKDEATAEQIIAKLDKGEKFDVLAKANSIDPSKNNGGDLGWFVTSRMVPAFAGAVVALKPGEYTHRPVQTQYGWHVIQLLDTRDVTPPPFDQVRQRLEESVQAKKFRDHIEELMREAKIQKFLDQPSGTAPGSAAPAAPGNTAPAAPGNATPTPTPEPAPTPAPAATPQSPAPTPSPAPKP
jgi:peptidyl-prolyl cis-trans isomerase C